jgi:uroporphyrinogen-III synthase
LSRGRGLVVISGPDSEQNEALLLELLQQQAIGERQKVLLAAHKRAATPDIRQLDAAHILPL